MNYRLVVQGLWNRQKTAAPEQTPAAAKGFRGQQGAGSARRAVAGGRLVLQGTLVSGCDAAAGNTVRQATLGSSDQQHPRVSGHI